MKTECTLEPLPFHPENRRTIQANFNGEFISSEGGALLLRETELQTQILSRLSHGFTDHRAPELIEHSLAGLVKQRVYGLALGYEDLNDHDPLRLDPLLAVLCGKQDPLGKTRERDQDKGKALAGKSTLNRLELTPKIVDDQERYKKISADHAAMDDWLVDLFLESYDEEPEWMTLDVDATADRVHGDQEGGYYSGYYRHDCYLPLYIFSGHEGLCARLHSASTDPADGTLVELQRIVRRIRQHWPTVRILFRGDGGFCREELMVWCEDHRVDDLIGLVGCKDNDQCPAY